MTFDPATLIGPLLDTIGDDAAFGDFAGLLVQTTLSISANFQIQSAAGVVSQTAFGMSPDALQLYNAYYWKHDLWASGYQASAFDTLVNGNAIVSDDDFRRSKIYNDCLKHNGDQFRVAGLVANIDTAHQFVFGVHRTSRQNNFDDRILESLRGLAPMLVQVMRARLRLARSPLAIAASIAEDDVDAVMVVGGDGALKYANREASRMLDHGLPFQRTAGRVTAAHRDFSLPFQIALRWACNRKGGQTLTPSTDGRYRIDIDPLTGPAVVLAKVRVVDTLATLERRIESATAKFGLSASEKLLLRALATGARPTEIAVARQVSIATVRTQLRSLFEKTGTSRQSDLLLQIIGLDQRLSD